jgi:metallo-beta-lactamase family protein
VDCGLYQGTRELRRHSWEPFPYDARSLDAVVLTHADLDHCGYLPALAAAGFRGPVYATEGTAALARIVLLDSAHLLDGDAQHANRHRYSKHSPALPLYTVADVERALSRVVTVPFGVDVEVAPDVVAHWRRAGHILGSASVHLRLGAGPSVLLSGDLGRPSHPVLAPPDRPPASAAVVIESTYDGRTHSGDDRELLAAAIRRTVDRGGTVLVPAFAVDRTEVVLHALRGLMRDGAVPQVPVHVDSPMALRALALYRAAVRRGDVEIRPGLGADGDPFDTGQVTRPVPWTTRSA